MSLRSRSLPGTRWLMYAAGLAGLVRLAKQPPDGGPSEPIDPTTHAEKKDVHARWVLVAGIGVLLFTWAVILCLFPVFNYFKYSRTGGLDPAKILPYIPKQPPSPRNESSPAAHLNDYLARQNQELSTYRWVDRGKGVASIPIERAIQILAAQGIPPSKPGGAAYGTPQAGDRLTGFEGKVEPLPR